MALLNFPKKLTLLVLKQLSIAVTVQGIKSERLTETSQLLAKPKKDAALLTLSK
jgi:hypothetical protein